MTKQGSFLLGLAVGAGMMYVLDPDRGRRRRALIRDQLVHGVNELEELGGRAGSRARHLRNRAAGAVHETRARMGSGVVDDPVLEGRVRTELGRVIASPGRVEVTADHGRVVLSGRVSAGEMDALLRAVEGVRGVHDLVNRLQAHEGSTGPATREPGR